MPSPDVVEDMSAKCPVSKQPVTPANSTPQVESSPEPQAPISSEEPRIEVVVVKRPTPKSEPKTPITILVPEGLAKKIRLLCSIENLTLSAVFVDAIAESVPKRLRAALASMEEDDK